VQGSASRIPPLTPNSNPDARKAKHVFFSYPQEKHASAKF
jgi:hypothetical protein